MVQCQTGAGPLSRRLLAATRQKNGIGVHVRVGQKLQAVCRWVGREVRFGPKTDLIPTPNPVAHASCPLEPSLGV